MIANLLAHMPLPPAVLGTVHRAGIPVPENEERWRQALDALRGVWASKYNDR
jgi:hypothetical protein